MNKRRLLKLADLLEADAKNLKGISFDLMTWARPSESIDGSYRTKLEKVPVDCGTSACAVGLACISGAFRRSGLSYVYKRWNEGFYLIPQFGTEGGMKAVQSFFGIDRRSADFLFASDNYPEGKRQGAAAERFVARRIRDFVSGKF